MTKTLPTNAVSPLLLLSVLLLALALRVWGITWGLPSATHYFSYHPDETVVLQTSSLTMNLFAGRLLPHFYDYGSLQLYLVCFANTLAALFGVVDIVPRSFAEWYPQWARMYLIGRLLTVGMGVGTVWATYALGATLWDRRAGLFAALILAIMPLHAQHSHFLTVDVPATFWVMLSLLWSAKLAVNTPKPLKAALLAGLFAGLAAATKYNMALAVLPALAACFLNSSPSRFGRVGACAGVGALAFFAACPGSLLETGSLTQTGTFLHDVHFEAVHVQNGDDPTFSHTGSGFLYHITHNLDAGLGLPLLVLALVSVGYAAYRHRRGDGLLAAFALPYYVLISLAAVRYARYTIPLLPFLALWTGRMLADGSRLPRPALRNAAVAAGAVVFFAALRNTVNLVLPMTQTDPRDIAFAQLQAAHPGATVGFLVQPWFGAVPISPYFTLPHPGTWVRLTPPEIAQRIVYSGENWDADFLLSKKPDYIAVSEYDYDDAARLNDPDAVDCMEKLTENHPFAYVLKTTVPEMREPPVFVTRGLPHDMLYPNPIISIYERKSTP